MGSELRMVGGSSMGRAARRIVVAATGASVFALGALGAGDAPAEAAGSPINAEAVASVVKFPSFEGVPDGFASGPRFYRSEEEVAAGGFASTNGTWVRSGVEDVNELIDADEEDAGAAFRRLQNLPMFDMGNFLHLAVDPTSCIMSPNPRVHPEAKHFVVECPASVETVTVHFHTNDEVQNGAPVRFKVYDARGNELQKLNFFPEPENNHGLVSAIVNACSQTNPQQAICQQYQIDVIRAGAVVPRLETLVISHTEVAAPDFDPTNPEYRVTMHAFEPATITATAGEDFFVDFAPPEAQRRAIEHGAITTFTPNVPAGGSTFFKVYVTNRSRDIVSNYTVLVDTVISTDPRLLHLETSTGRLEPKFNRNVFSYQARVPEGTKKLTMNVQGVNRKETVCTVNGQQTIVGEGKVTVAVTGQSNDKTVIFHCVANDGSHDATYIVHVVEQKGGTTILKDLRVVGADDPLPKFDPFHRGPYAFDVRTRAMDQRWIAFKAVPENDKAIVEIEGLKVDEVSHISPFYQLRVGERKRFTVTVRTPENPSPETYYADVDRRGEWYENYEQTVKIADFLGWTSTIVSSTNGPNFIHNAKYLQFMSATSRLNGLPSTYQAFAEALNKFNLQPENGMFVRNKNQIVLNSLNITAHPAGGKKQGLLLQEFEVSDSSVASAAFTVDGQDHAEHHENLVDISDRFSENFAAAYSAVTGKSALAAAVDGSSDADAYSRGHVVYPEYDSKSPEADTQLRSIVKRVLLDSWGAFEQEVEHPDGQSSTRIVAPRRRLFDDMTPEQKYRALQEIEAKFNDASKFVDYTNVIMGTSTLILIIAVSYVILWVTYLGGGPQSKGGMRKDFPSFLHPNRFWLFLLDYAFIAYCQACVGLTFMDQNVSAMVLGFDVNRGFLIGLSIFIMLVFPVGFLLLGSYMLSSIRGDVLFGHHFNRYHDRNVTEVKAYHKYLGWLPIIHNFLQIEITGVAPIQSTDGGSVVLQEQQFRDGPCYNADPSIVTGGVAVPSEAASSGGAPPAAEYSRLPEDEAGEEYDKATDSLAVDLRVVDYNTNAQYTDSESLSCIERWPEASFGRATHLTSDPYGQPLRVDLDLQLRHLAPLTNMVDSYPFLAGRENLELDRMSTWNILFAKAPRDGIFWWSLDRLTLFCALFFVNCYTDMSGAVQTIFFGLLFMMPLGLLIPSALAGGSARWYHHLKKTVKSRERKRRNSELHRDSQKVWPFAEDVDQSDYSRLRSMKRRARYCGLAGPCTRWVYTPVYRFFNDVFWNSRLWHTVVDMGLGPIWNFFSKFLILVTLFMGNRAVIMASNASASIFAVFVATVAVICLNSDSFLIFWKQIKLCAYELGLYGRLFAFWIGDWRVVWRRSAYLRSRWMLQASGKESPSYGDFSAERSRQITCQEVSVVQPTLGTYFPGTVRPTDRKYVLQLDEGFWQFASCKPIASVDKVLHTAGCLSVDRPDFHRAAPMAMSLKDFITRDKPHAGRCVATVQIVNHGAFRFPNGTTEHSSPENDSFLSLYSNPEFCPPFGEIEFRKPTTGGQHVVHSVNFSRLSAGEEFIVVRGPFIVKDQEYKLVRHVQRDPESDGYDPRTQRATTAVTGLASALCEEAGQIVVSFDGQEPDVDEMFDIEPPRGASFEIDPTSIHLRYNKRLRKLYMYHRNFVVSESHYTIRYTVQPALETDIALTERAAEPGVCYFRWPDKTTRPVMTDPFVLQNTDTQKAIGIHPDDTDSHEFYMPTNRFTGIGKWFYGAMTPLRNFFGYISGNMLEDEHSLLSMGPVPCTVIQCVHPVSGIYRVEPNFGEVARRLQARIEVMHALKQETNLPESLGRVCRKVMTQTQIIDFFAKKGIPLDDNGGWVNPLIERNHSLIRSRQKEVRLAESDLRFEVVKRIEAAIRKLDETASEARVWKRAFQDSELRRIVTIRDQCDWQMDLAASQKYSADLQKAKAPYEQQLRENFTYPMLVPDRLVCKKCDWDSQEQEWEKTLSDWFRVCENAVNESYAGGLSCAEHCVSDIIKRVMQVVAMPENQAGGDMKPMLHYAIDSRAVRGSDPEWMPDPMNGQVALVRVWKEDSTQGDSPDTPRGAHFGKPAWLPCYLKLDGTRVCILMPDEQDRRPDPNTGSSADQPWSTVMGWYIPLNAFDMVNCAYDDSVPLGAQESLFKQMTTKLTFRKSQKWAMAPDDYVFRLTDDSRDNLISHAGSQYRLMIGHTVDSDQVNKYRDAEPEPTLTVGGDVDVHPLQFRLPGRYRDRWTRTIDNSFMHKPSKQPRFFEVETREEPLEDPVPEEPEDQMDADEIEEESAEEILPEVIPALPKVPEARFRADWKDGRFDGWGVLQDPDDPTKMIYDGHWLDGKRWGRGKCWFKDWKGTEWKYDGDFMEDEMGGRGKLILTDQRRLEQLEKGQLPEDRETIVAWDGNFKLPRKARRSKSGVGTRTRIDFSAEVIRQLYKDDTTVGLKGDISALREEDVEPHPGDHQRYYHVDTDTSGSASDEDVDERAKIDHKKKLVVDVRRTLSSPGDDTVTGHRMQQFDDPVRMEGSYRTGPPQHKLSLDSFEDNPLLAAHADRSDDMPMNPDITYRSAWTRLLDPTLGYWRVEDRFKDGIVTFADGSRYCGTMQRGKCHGKKGLLRCFVGSPDGPRMNPQIYCQFEFLGAWNQGSPNGRGYMQVQHSEYNFGRYWGDVVDGKREGKGAYSEMDGKIRFCGVFKDDKLDSGQCCVEIDESLSPEYPYKKYVGQMENGVPHGRGKIVYHDGVVYTGHFKEGKRDGHGTMIDQGVRVFVGNWKKDLPDGLCERHVLPDGKLYCGEFRRGQREGMGELFSSEEDPTVLYEGSWRSNVPNGRGQSTHVDGWYDGEWRRGERFGKGSFTYKEEPAKNRRRFLAGEWYDDFPNGLCRYCDENDFEAVLKFDKGVLDTKSIRPYGRRNISNLYEIKKSEQFGSSPKYWWYYYQSKPEEMLAMHARGAGMWHKHCTHPYHFVKYDEALPLGPYPDDRSPAWADEANWSGSEGAFFRPIQWNFHILGVEDLTLDERPMKMGIFCTAKIGMVEKYTSPQVREQGTQTVRWDKTLNLKVESRPQENKVEFMLYIRDPAFEQPFVGAVEVDLEQLGDVRGKKLRQRLVILKEGVEAGKLDVTFGAEDIQPDRKLSRSLTFKAAAKSRSRAG